MNELLTKVLDAHGGLKRWRSYNKVEATIVSGGGFFPLKGVLQDANPRRVNIAGGFPAAQLMLEYTEANGIRLPSKRRAYTRGPDRRPILDMLMVSIDISDVAFS
jgi:hypothetical protein